MNVSFFDRLQIVFICGRFFRNEIDDDNQENHGLSADNSKNLIF